MMPLEAAGVLNEFAPPVPMLSDDSCSHRRRVIVLCAAACKIGNCHNAPISSGM